MEEDGDVHTPTAPQPKRTGKQSYHCKVCGENFNRAWALVQHLWIHTGEKPFRCDRCDRSFNVLANLHKHQRMKHNVQVVKREEEKQIPNTDEGPTKCDQCGKCCRDEKALRKHRRIKHKVPKYEVEKMAVKMKETPRKPLPNSDQRPLQRDQGNSVKTYFTSRRSAMYWASQKIGLDIECNQCGKRFPNMTRLNVHKRFHKGKKIPKCKFCGAEFLSASRLEIHERVHTRERPFKCDLCGKGFTEEAKVYAHKRTTHKENNGNNNYAMFFKCAQCGCKFPSRRELTTHQIQYWHVGRPCRVKIHQRTSDTEKDDDGGDQSSKIVSDVKEEETPAPISASSTGDECGKGFTSQQQLLRYKDLHTGKTMYKCKYCGKDCLNKSTLITHERVHTGEQPFSCVYCDRRFSVLGNLRVHQRNRHPGKKLTYVTKNFDPSVTRQTPALRPHQKHPVVKPVTIIPKPHKCEYCGKCFKSKHHLQEHRYVHIGRPYKCDVCGRAFIRQIQLLRHQKCGCGIPLFRCHCGDKFVSQALLRTHQQQRHRNHFQKCKHCYKMFIDADLLHMHTLRFHETSHTDEEEAPYDPHEDGEKSTADTLDEYSCDHCEESFADQSSLAFHKCIDQSTAKTLTCKDCGTVVKVGGTTLSNVFTVTDLSNVKCFINNHTLF